MIRVDSRIGSGELENLFKAYGIRVEKTKLDFGDFDFEGLGPKGKCGVVFERKRIEDLVDSMLTHRLTGHQLPGIADNYDYGYLIVEGLWRGDKDGLLEINGGRGWVARNMKMSTVTNFVMGLTLRAGLIPWRTGRPEETVAFIVDQYRMWGKPWDDHQSHLAAYAPAERVGGFGLSLVMRKVGQAEKVAMQLPGLDGKAKWAARHFGSVFKLAQATRMDWAKMPWKTKKGEPRMLGQITADKVYEAIRHVD